MKELLPTLLNHALPPKVIVKPNVLLLRLFSDNIIFSGVGRAHHGLCIEKFLEHCEEKDILTSSQTSSGHWNCWLSCPDLTVASQEASFASFLNQLSNEVHVTTMTSDHPVPYCLIVSTCSPSVYSMYSPFPFLSICLVAPPIGERIVQFVSLYDYLICFLSCFRSLYVPIPFHY